MTKTNQNNLGARNRFEDSEWKQKVVDLRRVVRVMAGGKRFKFRAVVILGNRLGKVGVGVDKGEDVSQAIEKATRDAKRNIIEVPFVKDTIPHEISAKYKAAKVIIKPASQGVGVIAGGAVRVVLDLAGVKNVTAKILSRSANKLNNARVAVAALKQLRSVK